MLENSNVMAEFCPIETPTNDKYNPVKNNLTNKPKTNPSGKNKGFWNQLSKTSVRTNLPKVGKVNPMGTTANIIKDLIKHTTSHYEGHDEKILLNRLKVMGDQAIEDLVVDEGAFHHFLMTTNSQSRSSLYGLGEHASNMTSDYKITIKMTTSPDPTTF